jgi:aminoglycoside phosphotransferase (APT) family kinase protein
MEAGAALPLDTLRTRVPALDAAEVVILDAGWDSVVYLAGEWIFRVPRRPEVAGKLESEAALLAALSSALPAAVPRLEIVDHDGVTVACHRRIEGEPAGPRASASDIGRFLAALHGFPPSTCSAGPDGSLAGVIDWTDARIGDPAIDFAWLLNGGDAPFAAAVVEEYGEAVDAAFRARAAFFHLLGPWHEVVYGLDAGQPRYVASGLAGVRAPLPAP